MFKLSAKMEPFDSFWEAPNDIQKGYKSFAKFYKRNYFKFIPNDKTVDILVVSCGPGYFVNLLKNEGYTNVIGIDSDAEKIKYATNKGLQCERQEAFPYLENCDRQFDIIVAEQEINHLTLEEILNFFELCRMRLKSGGALIVHSINGANPIVGIESFTQNIDHFNSFTEYSLKQILECAEFKDIIIFPLNLYIFYENPLNYVGFIIDRFLSIVFRLSFLFYGKSNKIFSKKIAAIGKKSS